MYYLQGKVSIRITPDSAGRHVIVKIQDTGCGIPQADMANLLVPFKQVIKFCKANNDSGNLEGKIQGP